MPWTVDDVEKHIHGLSDSQKRRWVAVANSVMQRCTSSGGSDCEGRAIQMANGVSRKAVWTTAYMNNLPDSSFLFVESGGKKDGEGKTVPRGKRHFPYKDANGKVDLPHLRNAIARIPQSNAPGLNKDALQARARKLLSSNGGGGSEEKAKKKPGAAPGLSAAQQAQSRVRRRPRKNQISSGFSQHPSTGARISGGFSSSKETGSSLHIFKQADGSYRWVLYSSNPYQDRDSEFVTLLAQERDISKLESTGDYGPLRWWHMGDPYFEHEGDWKTVKACPGVDIGTCDFAAMHDRIRVESGTFKSDRIGRAIAKHYGDLEGSLGFSHPRSEPDEGGGFLHIKTFERSLTPAGMASNPFTSLMVGTKEKTMDSAKLKALKDLGVDIDEVLEGAEEIQSKANGRAPYRLKSDDLVEEDEDDVSSKLDKLTAQLSALQEAMKEGEAVEPDERIEDLMVTELTVGELQDVIAETISTKSANPTGVALKAVLEELQEIKAILTSKSVQSVVDEVARMKAKLERLTAKAKATASKVRELDDDKPRVFQRGVRPSESDDTLLDFDLDGDLSQKSNSNNPFDWLEGFVEQRQG